MDFDVDNVQRRELVNLYGVQRYRRVIIIIISSSSSIIIIITIIIIIIIIETLIDWLMPLPVSDFIQLYAPSRQLRSSADKLLLRPPSQVFWSTSIPLSDTITLE